MDPENMKWTSSHCKAQLKHDKNETYIARHKLWNTSLLSIAKALKLCHSYAEFALKVQIQGTWLQYLPGQRVSWSSEISKSESHFNKPKRTFFLNTSVFAQNRKPICQWISWYFALFPLLKVLLYLKTALKAEILSCLLSCKSSDSLGACHYQLGSWRCHQRVF